MIRPPAVAGHFYSANPTELARNVDGYLAPGAEKRQALGCVVPQGGFIYSGHRGGGGYFLLRGQRSGRRSVALCRTQALSPRDTWRVPYIPHSTFPRA